MKRTLRLTESDLHRIVKESVNRVLKEINLYNPEHSEEDEMEDLRRDGEYAQSWHPQTDNRNFAREYTSNLHKPTKSGMKMFHDYHRQNKYY